MAENTARAPAAALVRKNTNRSPAIPVALTEAALDSPSFRATAVHFGDQMDGIERWLDGYHRATSKLAHDVLALDESINSYLGKIVPSPGTADNVIDHDYTLLALKRVSDGSRGYWTQTLAMARKMESASVEPIKAFLGQDMRMFRDARRNLDLAQKTFDSTLARYLALSKTKEPSALREEAFAVFETRKAYVKSSLDFCQLSPQVRLALDKLLIRISSDTWHIMMQSRDGALSSAKWSAEIDRIRGWSKDMEGSEAVFKRELQVARREVGEATMLAAKPSRELENYSASTIPFLGSRGPVNAPPDDESALISERQGWLFLKTATGKPVRTSWIRRWYYCKDGIFGWLVQGPHGVLQGDEIGVLLCSAKPAVAEDRRFCFQVKTKNQTLTLQAETQSELSEWLEVFEVAKKRAFEATIARDSTSGAAGTDPAFSIVPPAIPEFSARVLDSIAAGEDPSPGSLPMPGEGSSLAPRPSFDVNAVPARRSFTALGRDLSREEGESNREHATRIMQKLDIHRKSTFGAGLDPSLPGSAGAAGGIASLISASHNLLPGPARAPPGPVAALGIETPAGSLAPATLGRPPVATNLSRFAVIVTGERGLAPDISRTMSAAVMANYWGSNTWSSAYSSSQGNFSRLTDVDPKDASALQPTEGESVAVAGHRKTPSADPGLGAAQGLADRQSPETFPPRYPVELKMQHAQFRLLFPTVPLDEKLVLVFRAAWSSSGEKGFDGSTLAGNGRVFVTPDNMYFYGHQLGLVVAYSISLDIITEVTATAGRDCDLTVLRLGEDMNDTGLTRITIRTYLEDIHLLHARLNLLVDDLQAEEPMELDEIISHLIELEREEVDRRSPSAESWEEVDSDTPIDDGTMTGRPVVRHHRESGLHGRLEKNRRRHGPKVQLPTSPIVYEPEDMQKKVAERHFEISAKSCFHVLFGDKSFIFPKLYFDRQAQHISQGPWTLSDHGRMRREFQFKANTVDMLGRSKLMDVTDYQVIDILSDHVTYVVSHVKTAWHLPHSQMFKLVTKTVITHVAKSKCKLAIFIKADWSKSPGFSKNMVERQALEDAAMYADELAEVATDQVRRLGSHSRTKRAIQVYGHIGHQIHVVNFSPADADTAKKQAVKPRTLTDMVFETLRSLAQSAVTSILMWSFAGVQKLFGVVTAHRLIILLLFLSSLTNLFLTSRESSVWWVERKAARYMGRLGVGPNVMMSKAIYLGDLADASGPAAHNSTWPEQGMWYVAEATSVGHSPPPWASSRLEANAAIVSLHSNQ